MPVLFTLPHLIALIIAAWVVYYSWKRGSTSGIKLFIWYTGGYILWIAGFIFELTSPALETKLFWDTFQWVVTIATIPALPVFAYLYKNKELKQYERTIKLTITLSLILIVLSVTNNLHGLFYYETQIDKGAGFGHSVDQAPFLFYTLAIYIYIVFVWGISILLEDSFKKKKGLYHKQTLLLALGFMLPMIGFLLDIVGIKFFLGQSIIPIAIALGNALNAWSLAQYNIFLISPVNRDEAFEAMMDPVVILDNNNTIIDINRSMLDLLGKEARSVIGENAKEIFDNSPIPITLYSSVSYARTETTFDIKGKTVHYEMSVWPILDKNRNVISRLYIAHDITALKELEEELRNLNNKLEARVRERTQELADSYNYTLEGWAKALELRDKETEGHSRRVTETTVKVARAYGIPEKDLEHIRRGAILHDIGKMAIADQVLLKPGKLTEDEYRIIKMHPIIAYNMLKSIPFLHKAIDIPYSHHERWDGNGYPQGLRETEIPLAARIFSVVDVWDALRSNRPYRDEWSQKKVVAHLVENAGKHFDPKVIDIFLDLVEKRQIQ